MIRRPSWILLLALSTSMTPGCASMFSKKAIERFAENMQAQNLDGLKSATSDEFEQKALRQDDSAKGLKMLKIPTGKVEIVSVEEIEPGRQKVIVKVGDKPKKKKDKDLRKEVEYKLSKVKNSWVVDDILLKQDSGGGQLVERSVTEQMDLLLSCREILISWREGAREEKLAHCVDSLREHLEPLPEAWFEKLSKEIAGPGNQSTFKPDARLNGSKAAIIVPHPQGNLYLELVNQEGRWKLQNLAVEPSSKESQGIRSLQKMATTLKISSNFLAAYEDANKEALSQSATSTFYKQCLSAADLSEVEIPATELLADSFEARQYTDGTEVVKRVELLLRKGDSTYMLTLREEEPVLENGTKGVAEFRVDEVTLFEKGDKDVRRMSSVYMTHAVTNVFVSALASRDVTRIKELSSTNFNDRVWNRPEASQFPIMAYPDIPQGEMEIISTIFRGDVSEVTVDQGGTPLTLILQAARGWMVVDDVQMPAYKRPISLKTNLEVLLTLQAFNTALVKKDIPTLIKHSADGLDRIAWRQLQDVPEVTQQFMRPLLGEVVSIELSDDLNIVRTVSGDVQADIQLYREGDHYVIHDVTLSNVRVPEQRLELLSTLRTMIAQGTIGPAAQRRAAIQQAAAEAVHSQQPVQQAVFEPLDPSVYAR